MRIPIGCAQSSQTRFFFSDNAMSLEILDLSFRVKNVFLANELSSGRQKGVNSRCKSV